MSTINGTQFIERIQFFNGERLFASDLQDLEAFNREMRWLHNQSLHQPGVGVGFAVTGSRGDREVTITPGYAIDSCGREIILTETDVEAIPPVADNGAGAPAFYDLTVSYPSDGDLKPSETREGICLPQGVVRLREAPVFCWVRLGDDGLQPVDANLKSRIQQGLMIVLARIEVFNCQLKQPVSATQRRNAKPARQPRIASAVRANGIWKVRRPRVNPAAFNLPGLTILPVQFITVVDTTTGNFSATPSYVARLIHERVLSHKPDAQTEASFYYFADVVLTVLADPKPTPTQFALEAIPVIGYFDRGQNVTVDDHFFDDWQVEWIGIED
ncbi:MAG TPA: hypothetical protein VNH18_03980 [Bryobacteraceae bacterium]|nr:hypothetical protein [Bryobacteraceae bacterium]